MGPLCFGFAFTLLGVISLTVAKQGMCQANLRSIHKVSVDGLVQERRNYSALAIEFYLCCTNPSIWYKEMAMTLAYLQGSCWALPTVTVPGNSLNQEIQPGPWFNMNKNIYYQYRKSHFGEIGQSVDRRIVLPPQWGFLYLCVWIRSLLISSDVIFTKWRPGGHIGFWLLLWVIN